MRRTLLLAMPGLLSCVLLARPARGQEERPSEQASSAGRYRSTPSSHDARAALEELIVIGGEGLNYWKDRDINSLDWDLSYSWSSFGDKLNGTAYSFDTNRFPTNFAYHPMAGTLYYLVPRANHLSIAESLGYAFATSSFWEILAEFRERVSINDMWITPLSGLSLGETTSQLGAFFDRGCDTAVNRFLGLAFGPVHALHDAIDDAQLRHARSCDAWGFDTASEHRFRLSLGAAQLRAGTGDLYRVSRARLETSIVDLPDEAGARSGWRGFSDGNVTDMALGLAYGPHDVSDMLIEARATVAGAQYRWLRGGTSRLGLGDRALFGVVVGMQYGLHRYEVHSPMDDLFLVDAPAITLRFAGRRPYFGFSLALDAGATFGGMGAFALSDYRLRHGDFGLTTIARQQGYNYVVGFALAPRATLDLNGAELGLSARGDRVTAIRVFDRYGNQADSGSVAVNEMRRRASLWLSVGPRTGARLTFSAEALERQGSVGSTKKSASELGLGLSLGVAL